MRLSAMFCLLIITVLFGCVFSRPMPSTWSTYEENWPPGPFAENEEYWGPNKQEEIDEELFWSQQQYLNDEWSNQEVYIPNEFEEAKKQEFPPDDIMNQFFNFPDTDNTIMNENSFKEEYENGLIQSNWETEEEFQNNPMYTDDEWREDITFQEILDKDTQVYPQLYPDPLMYPESEQRTFDYPQQENKFHDIDVESMWSDLNGEMESLQMENHEDERERITNDIDEAYKQIIETQNKLEALEERQDREGNVTECRIKICSPCDVKQICVSRNGWGECILEDVRECCHIDYEPRCKALKEAVRDEIGEQIVEVAAELEQIEKKLEEYSEELAELDKNILHPTDDE